MQILRLLIRHPISIISYIIYLFLCWEVGSLALTVHKEAEISPDKRPPISGVEALTILSIALLFLAALFVSVMTLNAAFRKKNNDFYWWMDAAIIISTGIALNI